MGLFRVTKKLKFCAAHRLYEYKGLCCNIHGHNFKVLITLQRPKAIDKRLQVAELDNLGMVIDFGIVKKKVQGWLDLVPDHSLILNADDPLLNALKDEVIAGLIPDLKLCVIDGNPTAEVLCNYIRIAAEHILDDIPVMISRIALFENDDSFAEQVVS